MSEEFPCKCPYVEILSPDSYVRAYIPTRPAELYAPSCLRVMEVKLGQTNSTWLRDALENIAFSDEGPSKLYLAMTNKDAFTEVTLLEYEQVVGEARESFDHLHDMTLEIRTNAYVDQAFEAFDYVKEVIDQHVRDHLFWRHVHVHTPEGTAEAMDRILNDADDEMFELARDSHDFVGINTSKLEKLGQDFIKEAEIRATTGEYEQAAKLITEYAGIKDIDLRSEARIMDTLKDIIKNAIEKETADPERKLSEGRGRNKEQQQREKITEC